MVSNTWCITTKPSAKGKVIDWLSDEKIKPEVLKVTSEQVMVAFTSIEDAFRFRIRFDEELI
jgi:hypothetical protein